MNKQKIAVEVAALGAAASGVYVFFIRYRAHQEISVRALIPPGRSRRVRVDTKNTAGHQAAGGTCQQAGA